MQEHKLLCVTHLVIHCCPPALLTQLYTSVMGLGLNTAGETAQPYSNKEWGLGVLYVWEDWVFGLNPQITLFDI